nr:acetoin utilization protein AcuC [Candidatus Bipolaricaulota bacterium]
RNPSGRSRVSFSPAGGLHHAMASRASGFCHVNDAVLAIHTLLAAGKRVAYVDIDAHHGDGVQHAFYERKDVLTISIHQSGHTIFPGTGYTDEAGVGAGEGYAINIPLLPGAGDAAYERCLERAILPALERYRPDVLVTQLGADALDGDLVASLAMSLSGFEKIVQHFAALGLPWVALGGGGYDVGNVVRAWVLAWAVMNHAEVADEIPDAWQTEAATYGVSVSSLRGSPSLKAKETPKRVMDALDREIDRIRERVFPLLESSTAGSSSSTSRESLSE